jgi:lysophospholipase L1-like esterase
MTKSYHTGQAEALLGAKICSPAVAELLGLSFADRDMELIERLNELKEFPEASEFPAPAASAAVARALAIEERWVPFTVEKVQRFVHKRRMNGDFSADIAHFANRPDVLPLREKARALRPGTTVFVGDSMMDNRHFSANASFAVLVGGLLESLGVGKYVNAGIGGNTAAQGLARFERDVMAHQPARVIFSFGSNDVVNGVPLEKMTGQFEQMIDRAQGAGADVVVGLTLNVIPERLWWNKGEMRNIDAESRRRLQGTLEDLARRKNARCMSVLNKLGAEYYCVDGIHINQAGQEICGVECLEQLVQ